MEIRLSDRLRTRVGDAILDRVRQAVEDNSERDRSLADLDAQLEGRAEPQSVNTRWKNACQLEDTLTREHHLQTLAGLTEAWRRTQFWLCEAIDPSEREAVRRVETYMNIRARQYGLAKALYDVAYTALASTFAPLYVGWRTYTAMVGERAKVTPDGEIVPPESPEEGEEYEIRHPAVAYNGLTFRSIEPSDFYLYPSGVQSVDDASAVIERIRFTAEQLVREFGEEAVESIVRSRPEDEENEQVAERNRLDGSDGDTLLYNLYVVSGSAPLLLDDDALPDWMMKEEFVWVVHPASRTVLSMRRSPTLVRPYVVFNAMRVPRRLGGHGICTLLGDLQAEATANLRYTIDCTNLASAPAMLVPEYWMHKYGKWAMYPGALVPYMRTKDELGPLTWDMRGVAAGMQLAAYLDGKAARLASAQGLTSLLGGKVRKAAEVEATQSVVGQKQDLFFQCLQEGLETVGHIVLSLFLDHMDAEGDIASVPGGEAVSVTPEDIRRRMKITAYATSEDSNAETRAQKTLFKRKVQSEYFAVLGQLPPYAWPMAWKGAYQSLQDVGEREPQEWLGPMPPEVPPPWMAPQTRTQQTAPALAGMAPGPVQPPQPVETGIGEQ